MIRILIGCFALSVLTVFTHAPDSRAADKVGVFVSILPQKFFVEQIGKDLVDIQVMVQPGASPHTYEPRPQQMVQISKARIYFAIGVTFENTWLRKIASSNPGMMVVHTDHGIQKMPMAAHDHPGENPPHQKEERDHGILDPHIWLAPPLVMIQARNILTALQEVDPAHHAIYEANYKAFMSMIVDLDGELRRTLAGKRGAQFMVFHPAWGYFAHTYGLTQVPIEIEGKDPKPAQLQKLIETARSRGIKVIFLQPQFSSRSAEQVAKEISGQVALVDPLALNWTENLRAMADKLKGAVK